MISIFLKKLQFEYFHRYQILNHQDIILVKDRLTLIFDQTRLAQIFHLSKMELYFLVLSLINSLLLEDSWLFLLKFLLASFNPRNQHLQIYLQTLPLLVQ